MTELQTTLERIRDHINRRADELSSSANPINCGAMMALEAIALSIEYALAELESPLARRKRQTIEKIEQALAVLSKPVGS